VKIALEMLLFIFCLKICTVGVESMRKKIAAIMFVMLAIGSFGLVLNIANGDTIFQKLWIRSRGFITHWGTTPVFGFLDAQVGIVNKNGTYYEWARVHAIWSSEQRRLNCSGPQPPPENFTFSFCSARMVQLTGLKLNISEGTLDIAGLWNVVNITTTIIMNVKYKPINITRTLTPIVTNATGTLHISDNFTKFVLDINGIDPLGGFCITTIRYIEIKICDTNDDGKVDLIDLVRVAKRYGSKPGMWNYDHYMDFNFNDEIDLGDLTTVAANMEG
jgi:hypothetical protein